MDELKIRSLIEDVQRGDAALKTLMSLGHITPQPVPPVRRSEKSPLSIHARVLQYFNMYPVETIIDLDTIDKHFPKILRRSLLSALCFLIQSGDLKRHGRKGHYCRVR